MPVQQNEKQRLTLDADEPISVTVDATDLSGASAEPLKAIIARYGRPVSARAFADFQQTSLAELAVQLYQLGFTLVHCPTWPNGDGFPKPVVTDILAQDLRDQLEELEGVETFLLAGTSREYIAVANALRRHDKRVIVVAEEAKVSRELRLCADEFVLLPPTKADRIAPVRTARAATARTAVTRPDRIQDIPRVEQAPEQPKIERVHEPVRPEPVRPAPVRIERAPEPVKVERPVEPVREVARVEPQEPRLPTDADVVAEVRRIVAAEGICTPRRLSRALCPVDRTPTGELRSRIANRIQSMIESGKLVREKLVVGGTSVETIIVGEDRNGRSGQQTPEAPAAQPLQAEEAVAADDAAQELTAPTDGMGKARHTSGRSRRGRQPAEPEKKAQPPVGDLDAFVESVLRSSEPVLPEPVVEVLAGPVGEALAEPVAEEGAAASETEAVTQEAPAKRPRTRRRSTSKKAAAPDKGPVAEPEPAS